MPLSLSLSLGPSPYDGNTNPDIPRFLPDLSMSRDQEPADPIAYEQLVGSHPEAASKQLTRNDVYDRLYVTKEMARLMPQANRSEIRVLDDVGDRYLFILKKRIGSLNEKPSPEKPTFQPSGWKSFTNKREAKPDDSIYFWPEVNEVKGTNYRINLFPSFIHFVSPEAEGLGDSNMAPPESQEETSDLRAWAVHGDLQL